MGNQLSYDVTDSNGRQDDSSGTTSTECRQDAGERLRDCLVGLTADVTEATHRSAVFGAAHSRLGDVYEYVWLGELNVRDWTFEPSTDSDTELVEAMANGDDAVHPAVETVLTTETVATVTPASGERETAAWSRHATAHGYTTAILVPVVHHGSTYGLLVLGTRESDPPTEANSTVLETIGTTLGRALTGIYRREALMGGDRPVVEFRIPDAVGSILGPNHPEGTTIRMDRTVPLPDGRLLQYVTVEGMDPETFRETVTQYDDVTHVRQIRGEETGEDGAIATFETVYTGPSILRTLVDHDARILASRFVDDDHQTVATLPPETDLNAVLDAVHEAFPDISVVSKRSLREERTTASYRASLYEQLTDRQRAAVESALAAGYFERPRASTGEEVASALGISKSTFSQHLRAAHRKVYGELFDEEQD